MALLKLKNIFLLMLTVAGCSQLSAQTYIEGMTKKNQRCYVNVNICELKVGDSLKFDYGTAGDIKFKKISKYKCKLDPKESAELCGQVEAEDVKWVIKSKRKKGFHERMAITINGKKIILKNRKVVKVKES